MILVIWNECESELKYFYAEDSFAKFSGVYINRDEEDTSLQDELSSQLYSSVDGAWTGPELHNFDSPILLGLRNEYTQIIHCGFLP